MGKRILLLSNYQKEGSRPCISAVASSCQTVSCRTQWVQTPRVCTHMFRLYLCVISSQICK
jgi:hypothetical protein